MPVHKPLGHHRTVTAILFPLPDHQPVVIGPRNRGIDIHREAIPDLRSESQLVAAGLPEFRPLDILVAMAVGANLLGAPIEGRAQGH